MEPKVDTTEKITININTVDLGYMDLLVSEGYYATRTEFIKTAIKRQMDDHRGELQRLVEKKEKEWEMNLVVGFSCFTKKELLRAKSAGMKLRITVVGLFTLASDIPMELLEETVESIRVYGVCRCSKEVKARYGL